MQIADFTDEKLDFIGALIYKAAAEWFAEKKCRTVRNECEQQKAS